MTCQTCGRPAENGQPTHWLGCAEAQRPDESVTEMILDHLCVEHLCVEPRKPWSGKGAKPKYCEKHSDPKNRK